jgi:hypothetical protein
MSAQRQPHAAYARFARDRLESVSNMKTERAAVGGEAVGLQILEMHPLGGCDEPLEQNRADASALIRVYNAWRELAVELPGITA